jgi:hypothetical protein
MEGGRAPPPAIHRQLRPQGDAGVGVAPQIPGQGALHETGVAALPSIRKKPAAVAGGGEPLAFDVGGLAGARSPDDQPRPILHPPGLHHRAAAVGPAEVAIDAHAEGDGAEVVVAHQRGPPRGAVHAPLHFALGAADLGGVDGLAAAGLRVRAAASSPTGMVRGSWGHRNAPGVG